MSNTQSNLRCLIDLLMEVDHSIAKHGSWQGYGPTDVCRAVSGEFNEYMDAVMAGDIHGEHGQIRELKQLVVVALKGFFLLGGCDDHYRG